MHRVIAVVAGLFVTGSHAAMTLQHEEFLLQLPGDWQQVESDDPERWNAESRELGSSVVLSIIPRMNLPLSRLRAAAEKLAEARRNSEQAARPGQKIVYGDQWIEVKPSGDVVEVAYAGYDESGMIFRFIGFVTQGKVLSLWVATSGRDNATSKRAFDQAFRGLRFYVP